MGAEWNNSWFDSDKETDRREHKQHLFLGRAGITGAMLMGRKRCHQVPLHLSFQLAYIPTLKSSSTWISLSSGVRESNLKQFSQRNNPLNTADFASVPVHLHTAFYPKVWAQVQPWSCVHRAHRSVWSHHSLPACSSSCSILLLSTWA